MLWTKRQHKNLFLASHNVEFFQAHDCNKTYALKKVFLFFFIEILVHWHQICPDHLTVYSFRCSWSYCIIWATNHCNVQHAGPKNTFTLKPEAPDTQTNTKLNNPALFWLPCSVIICHTVWWSPRCWFHMSVCCDRMSHYSNPICLQAVMSPALLTGLSIQIYKDIASFPWHVTSTFFLILPTTSVGEGGAMNGQDATLTEGKRKWSHSSPTRSWKEMENSEGQHWFAFCYISGDREAVWMPLIKAVPLFSSPLPLWHWLRPALAASTVPSCEQMGGTEQANMSGLMVYCKKYEDFAAQCIQFRFSDCSKETGCVLYTDVYSGYASIHKIGSIRTTLTALCLLLIHNVEYSTDLSVLQSYCYIFCPT